jgi:hypothetical protein
MIEELIPHKLDVIIIIIGFAIFLLMLELRAIVRLLTEIKNELKMIKAQFVFEYPHHDLPALIPGKLNSIYSLIDRNHQELRQDLGVLWKIQDNTARNRN